ncbi:hypothetical protein CQA49_06680 [Helicobacter sp. MIT 00-7814]|uniref:hypothetical protein n=1 Tax=unclassified Helicobacter TaxID=2593540 RepID=UPI000E1F02DF|nr:MULTISPECIES: hypothetical protein [unclassified Helicobacter]RDU53328.1 hypothetical protein CQA49_06680 [Helicobacter sp. MIT 00-7814]RDU54149.1 hypothetical protein CQA37_05920 [Helicobacter sp. MIT 99-10781]
MKGHELYKHAMPKELSRKKGVIENTNERTEFAENLERNQIKATTETNEIRNAVIIGFIYVLINLGISWCINEITNLSYVDNFFSALFSFLLIVPAFLYIFCIGHYIGDEIPDFGFFKSMALVGIPVIFVAFIYFSFLPDKINTTLKNEILASMDETEQEVFKERYSLNRYGFRICNRDDYSSQRCIDYLNDIIDDTKKKAQKLKNKEEFEKFEQEQKQEQKQEREYKMRALIQKLDI